MKLHDLQPPKGASKRKRIVGRGIAGKGGKTAGRGTKGQGARGQIKPGFEGGQLPLTQRIPKLKGFKNPFKVSYQVVNVARLAELFPEGGDVRVEDLIELGAVRDGQLVKVLGNGDLSVALQVSAHAFSASAKDKIEKAGGSANEL